MKTAHDLWKDYAANLNMGEGDSALRELMESVFYSAVTVTCVQILSGSPNLNVYATERIMECRRLLDHKLEIAKTRAAK